MGDISNFESEITSAVKDFARGKMYEIAELSYNLLVHEIQMVGMELTSGKSELYDPDHAEEYESHLVSVFDEIFVPEIVENEDTETSVGYSVQINFPENFKLTDNVEKALSMAFAGMKTRINAMELI